MRTQVLCARAVVLCAGPEVLQRTPLLQAVLALQVGLLRIEVRRRAVLRSEGQLRLRTEVLQRAALLP